MRFCHWIVAFREFPLSKIPTKCGLQLSKHRPGVGIFGNENTVLSACLKEKLGWQLHTLIWRIEGDDVKTQGKKKATHSPVPKEPYRSVVCVDGQPQQTVSYRVDEGSGAVSSRK